jgi:hypothetical protein
VEKTEEKGKKEDSESVVNTPKAEKLVDEPGRGDKAATGGGGEINGQGAPQTNILGWQFFKPWETPDPRLK